MLNLYVIFEKSPEGAVFPLLKIGTKFVDTAPFPRHGLQCKQTGNSILLWYYNACIHSAFL